MNALATMLTVALLGASILATATTAEAGPVKGGFLGVSGLDLGSGR